MPPGEKRLKEITDCINKYGRDYTAAKYNLSSETIRRYLRLSKEQNNDKENVPLDFNDELIFKKLSEKFSTGELKSLLNDKFQPQFGNTIYNFDGDKIKFAVLSDLHIGSQFSIEERIPSALEECKNQDVSLILFPGDITEGMSGRDGHVYELSHIGYYEQRSAVVNILEPYKNNFEFKMISGNHDLWYASKANMGALIVKDICELLNCEYLGEHEATIMMNGIKVMLWHGEDGASYALSYRIQKIIESLSGGEKPQILITGHDHKQGYFFTRNIHTVMGGCIQKQTPWMRRKKLAAHEGFWIIEMTARDAEVKKFKTEWIPFYI